MILFPVGPDRPSRRRPVVTWMLIGVCVAAYISGLATGEEAFVRRCGFVPSQGVGPGVLLHLFAHAGLGHLAGNLLFLWAFGPTVEACLGPLLYAAAYLGLGMASGLAHGLATSAPDLPLIGASGAISALIGMQTALLPLARLRIFYFVWWGADGRSGVARWPIGSWAAFWVATQLFWIWIDQALGLRLSVAFGAHLTGFGGGVAVGFAWRRFVPEWERRARLRPDAAGARRVRDLLEAARVNLAGGHRAAARRAFEEARRIDSESPAPPGLGDPPAGGA